MLSRHPVVQNYEGLELDVDADGRLTPDGGQVGTRRQPSRPPVFSDVATRRVYFEIDSGLHPMIRIAARPWCGYGSEQSGGAATLAAVL